MSDRFHIRRAVPDDAPDLAEIRAETMRPSLEAVGRYDPQRVRERFLSTFVASDTFIFHEQDTVAGFYVWRTHPDHFYLDHLYVRSIFQGRGLGKRILRHLQEEAKSLHKPIRLMALRDSPANAFYDANGFQFERQEAFDNHYVWK